MGRAFTTTRTAAALGSGVTAAATIGVGYTTGAVAGTIIVGEAEERGIVYEGAQADVLDFYLLKGGTSETSRVRDAWYESDVPVFNIPGDVKFIAKHYWKKWT